MTRGALVLLLFAAVATAGHAQGVPIRSRPAPTVVRPDTLRRDSLAAAARRPPGDTTRRKADSTVVDTATVHWVDPDSVMKSLLARAGYDVTKFQGGRATYDARTKDLRLDASKSQVAAVDRNGQTSVSDSAIYSNQTTNDVTNLGHYIITLPGAGQAPIRGFGQLLYNSGDREGQFTNAKLPVNNGQNWFLDISAGAVQLPPVNSTAPAGTKPPAPTIFIEGLKLTSCTDSIWDYYFQVATAKRTSSNTIVGRNVVMYVGEVPVLWLPFIVQNTHGGRNSGMLTTRFSVSDIIRNSPTYHRNIENLGYYWVLNDYMDVATWLDWRSGAGGSNPADPGWLRSNVDYKYNWANRFLSGGLAAGYEALGNGSNKLDFSWLHHQMFANDASLNLDVNYTTSTAIQQRNTIDPIATTATIYSQAAYTRKIGPASLSIGGDRRQFPGRAEVDQTFPTLTISSAPINLGPEVVWTPGFSYTATSQTDLDQTGLFSYQFFTRADGVLDSTKVRKNSYKTSMSLTTPFKIFGEDLGNSLSLRSSRDAFPDRFTLHDPISGDSTGTRIYAQSFETDVDWVPTFQLPPFFHNKFNLAPSVSYANVDPGPYLIETERTNGNFVQQSKRLSYGVSASPTIYGLFGGFGPFAAFRHSISPTIGYNYAPKGNVSDEYLAALGRWRKGYIGDIEQQQLSFGVNTVLEGKVASPADTTPGAGTKMKVLSITTSPFSYNFERTKAVDNLNKHWWSGLTTEQFTYSLQSDLLPGIEFSSGYSLFQGSTTSDTAVFKPYHEQTSARLVLSRDQNPLAVLTKLFGRPTAPAQNAPVPPEVQAATAQDSAAIRQYAAQPVAGVRSSGERFDIPPTQGWQLSLNLSYSHPRPPVGGNILNYDPAAQCDLNGASQQQIDNCKVNARLSGSTTAPVVTNTVGGTVYRVPPTTNIASNFSFNLTPRWTAAWQTNYDVERHEFAEHIVSLQRDLHDWRLIMGFTEAANGNFAFSFSIGLKAEPDLKFDYSRSSIRSLPF
jgi:hypothetical protein